MEEKLKKIANVIRIKIDITSHKDIDITALELPKGISTYLQNYGYRTAERVLKMKEEDLIELTKCEEVLNSLHDTGIYFVWEESEDLKDNNILTINEIGLTNREKGALVKNNITTIVELEIFIRTEKISRLDGIGTRLLESIIKKHSDYMEQCDEKTYNQIVAITNEVEAIIGKKGYDFDNRISGAKRKKIFEKIANTGDEIKTESADKDLITVFREIFGGIHSDEEVELEVMIKALLDRKRRLEKELVLYGKLTKQQEEELRSIDSIKDWEK